MLEKGVSKGQEKEGRGAGSRDLTSRSWGVFGPAPACPQAPTMRRSPKEPIALYPSLIPNSKWPSLGHSLQQGSTKPGSLSDLPTVFLGAAGELRMAI